MRLERILYLAVATFSLLPCNMHGQKSANWRVYKSVDGLRESFTTAITINPLERVWVRHGEFGGLSWLDGYTVTNIASPPGGAARVHESRTGQIWSIYSDGLQELRNGQWIQYPIAEIQAENRTNLLRKVRPIPLLPIEHDHVLFLVSERLMEFDAATKRLTILKDVRQTRLERFFDLIRARDDGAWVTGAKGLAKIFGPLRQIAPDSEWRESLLDESLGVQNLQRPLEDGEGGICAVGESANSNKRLLIYFDGSAWKTFFLAGETIRQGWRTSDGTFWVLTISSLGRLAGENLDRFETEDRLTGQFYDVVTAADDVFWLATSEGLVRHARLPWRISEGFPGSTLPVHAISEDTAGGLWFASREHLVSLTEGRWRRYPLPTTEEPPFPVTDALLTLASGKIALTQNGRLFVFDPVSEVFEQIAHPEGYSVKILGRMPDGSISVQLSSQQVSEDAYHIETFDGAGFNPFIIAPAEWNEQGDLTFLYVAKTSDVWLGGTGGVARFREGKWQSFGKPDGYIAGGAFCVLERANGQIWCGGRERISSYDGKKWSIVYAGFDRVNSMLESRDNIWVTTSEGVFRYWKDSWTLNATEEGLPGASLYAVHEDRRGQLWVGSGRGIYRYYPETDPHPPKTFISTREKQIEASADGVITLNFHGQDKWKYTPPHRLFYSTRIDNGPWSPYLPENFVSLTNLAGGAHRIAVRSMDRNWNEDAQPAIFEFSVILPWYRDPRLVAISLLGFAVVLFFAGLAFNRHRSLVRSYAEVENIVAQRTSELERANQELLHSQKMKALGTLAAGIAHDFNNILSIIKGSIQIIEAHPEDAAKVRTRVSRIKTVVDQGAGIVKALLGYSRAREKDLVPLDLPQVVDETLHLLGDRFLQQVEITLDLEPSFPKVRGVKDLIQQILFNLILNAADAMENQGRITLRLRKSEKAPANSVLQPLPWPGYAALSVADTGTGIAPDVLPRIFEPFFTTKGFSARRGTGLGLSMVYEFAKDMGFGIAVESSPGQGATFTLLIPLALPENSSA